MKIKYIYNCIILAVVAALFVACEKDTDAVNLPPIVKTGQASNIMRTSADLAGVITATDSNVESYGILLDVNQNMGNAVAYPSTSQFNNGKQFAVSISGLEIGRTYYYSAYAHSGYNRISGEVMSFTTPRVSGPAFAIATSDNTTSATTTVTAEITDDGGQIPSIVGFVYKEIQNESEKYITKADAAVSDKSDMYSAKKFTMTLSGLLPNRMYAVRPYGINSEFGYGEPIIVRTNNATYPVPSKVTIESQGQSVVMLSATIIDPGTSAVTERGFVYSQRIENPTVENSNVIKCDENFIAELYDLIPGQTYYIRSYARNNSSEEYGYSEVTPYTASGAEPTYTPVVATVIATDITSTSARLVGYLKTYDIRVEAGFVFDGNRIPVTSEDGTFVYEVNNLEPETEYYFNTFYMAENGMEGHGQEVMFKTSKPTPSEGDVPFPGKE